MRNRVCKILPLQIPSDVSGCLESLIPEACTRDAEKIQVQSIIFAICPPLCLPAPMARTVQPNNWDKQQNGVNERKEKERQERRRKEGEIEGSGVSE